MEIIGDADLSLLRDIEMSRDSLVEAFSHEYRFTIRITASVDCISASTKETLD